MLDVIVTICEFDVVLRSVASVSPCVSVCPVRIVAFESLDIETSFRYAGISSQYL